MTEAEASREPKVPRAVASASSQESSVRPTGGTQVDKALAADPGLQVSLQQPGPGEPGPSTFQVISESCRKLIEARLPAHGFTQFNALVATGSDDDAKEACKAFLQQITSRLGAASDQTRAYLAECLVAILRHEARLALVIHPFQEALQGTDAPLPQLVACLQCPADARRPEAWRQQGRE